MKAHLQKYRLAVLIVSSKEQVMKAHFQKYRLAVFMTQMPRSTYFLPLTTYSPPPRWLPLPLLFGNLSFVSEWVQEHCWGFHGAF